MRLTRIPAIVKSFHFRLNCRFSGAADSYYKILGVEPYATSEEIQEAFVKLASEIYPNVQQGTDFTRVDSFSIT